MKQRRLWKLNDLDSGGRGRKRDEEEGGTRRNVGQGGWMDEEEGWSRRKERRGGRSDEESEKMKNEKVA